METKDAISLDKAINDAANWRAIANTKLKGNDYIKAFLIPVVDFSEILCEGAVGIRAYLGSAADGSKKLLLVGVDAHGKDMIDYDNGEYVFDFTTPCPAMCDVDSPLNERPSDNC